MTAILHEDPPDFPSHPGIAANNISPALERIVRHCLEKQPAQRFQSAHDIAFDLESVSSISATSPATGSTGRASRRWFLPAAAVAAALILGAGAGYFFRRTPPQSLPALHRITFRRGTIFGARFTPDGNLIYSAAWDGKPAELFVAQRDSTESRVYGLTSANILGISSTGELALSLRQHFAGGFEYAGVLARAPQGGAPRELIEGVEYADWSPDGTSLAAVRRAAGKARLEFPIGKVVYGTPGWISHARVSPDGTHVAFIDHPYFRDDAGRVAVIDKAGNKKILSTQFVSLQGLAWRPDGREIWFSGTKSGSNREISTPSTV